MLTHTYYYYYLGMPTFMGYLITVLLYSYPEESAVQAEEKEERPIGVSDIQLVPMPGESKNDLITLFSSGSSP